MKLNVGITLALLLLFTLNPQLSLLRAQGTAFTYQGRLNDGTNAANGNYDLRFELFGAASGGTSLNGPLTNAAVPISNGLFTVHLDFGPSAFEGSARWLELGVRPDGAAESFNILSPRQPITSAPYAVRAATAGTASSAVVAASANSVLGSNITGTIAETQIPPNIPRTNEVWLLGGNAGTTAGAHFMGTTDQQPLELRVNGLRASRLEPTPDDLNRSNMVNVVHGAPVNLAVPGVRGATISGGGAGSYDGIAYTNRVAADLGTIAGGAGNSIEIFSDGSSVGGGSRNRILGAYNATIAGGVDNTIQGGSLNAVIAGGQFNGIQAGALASTIGGGFQNTIQTIAYDANVGGYNSTIAGGLGNTLGSPYGAIGGGGFNSIGTNSNTGVISGGYGNVVANHSWDVTIGGGSFASVGTNSYYATIGGGRGNSIGDNAGSSTIGGGGQNVIRGNASGATIAGGELNTIGSNAVHAVVAGGTRNVANGRFSFAGGYRAQANHVGSFAWADDSEADFNTTTNRQVAFRAQNGVRIQATSTALDLQGGGRIRVAGAGLGSATPAFIHRATAANSGGNSTFIDHPHCNGDPSAILFVTQNWNPPGGLAVYNAHPVGVWYTGSQWAIFNQDGAVMPANAAFNVLIIKP